MESICPEHKPAEGLGVAAAALAFHSRFCQNVRVSYPELRMFIWEVCEYCRNRTALGVQHYIALHILLATKYALYI